MASPRCVFRCFLLSFLVFFLFMLIVGLQILGQEDLDDFELEQPSDYDIHEELSQDGIDAASKEAVAYPIIMWWTPFTREHSIKSCGHVKCFFTNDRHYKHHPKLKVFLFYGTDIHFEDLPLPREPHHEWALMHEESPKNVFAYSHKEVMELFNHTCTFKRESDFPITTQALDSIESLETTKYMVSTSEKNKLQESEGLSVINYVHSDCGTYSDRDRLITMIQRRLQVDSYGRCLHNKDLPEHLRDPIQGMDHEDFYNYQAKYKFSFATENALCDDYITEKFWRALMVGSVPVVLGSSKIKDFLPTNHSAILLSDFQTVDELVDYLLYLNSNDEEYEKYLTFKKPGGVTNKLLLQTMHEREWAINNDWRKPNFISSFECFVCNRLHENIERESRGEAALVHQADVTHYGCPKPLRYSDSPAGNMALVDDRWFAQEWVSSSYQAKALKEMMDEGAKITMDEIRKRASLVEYKEKQGGGY